MSEMADSQEPDHFNSVVFTSDEDPRETLINGVSKEDDSE